jgi:hypothetical protein
MRFDRAVPPHALLKQCLDEMEREISPEFGMLAKAYWLLDVGANLPVILFPNRTNE